jgi:predicted porin
MTVFAPEQNAPVVAQAEEPFQYGIFNLRPHPYYRVLSGNGILSSTNQAENTVINQISPGFLLEIGRHWTVDYTPAWTFYSNNHFRDTLDHAVTLAGGTSYEDWTFGLSQGFTLSSDPLVETATQTSQKTFSTAIKASYQFNSKMSTDLGVSQNIISADQFTSSREWSTLDWLNYEFWPRLNAGVGVGLGYDDVQTGPDMIYEQLQSRVNWRATDKISFRLNGGLEEREFHGGAGSLLNFVFAATIQYQPIEVTKISISADRAVSPSYFVGQATENTDFIGDLNQRLLGKLYLDLLGGYHAVKYVASASNTSVNREDDLYSVSVQLNYPFAQRGTISAFYQASSNSSTEPGFGYSSTQVGFQISYRF